MEQWPLSPHAQGHGSVTYFWKLVRSHFTKLWMSRGDCHRHIASSNPHGKPAIPQSCETFAPLCLHLCRILLQPYYAGHLEVIFFLFVVSYKNYSFVTLMQILLSASLPSDYPECTMLPFWNMKVLVKQRLCYLVEWCKGKCSFILSAFNAYLLHMYN